jgi:hypothetical protein
MIYAKPHVRKGLLGRMLKELLDTRVMVKHAMKGVKSDKVRFYLPKSRSLSRTNAIGSKACAGCPSTEFEVHLQRHVRLHQCNLLGRMPAVEIADSIVQSGRETLEKVSQGRRCILFYHVIVFRRSASLKPRRSGGRKSCMETQTLCSSICLERPRIKHFVSDTTSQIRSRS